MAVGVVVVVVVAVGVNVDVATCVLEVGVVTGVVVVVGVGEASRRSSESWAHNLKSGRGGRVTHRRMRGDAAVSRRRGVGR